MSVDGLGSTITYLSFFANDLSKFSYDQFFLVLIVDYQIIK